MGSQAANDRDRIVDHLVEADGWVAWPELCAWLTRTVRLTIDQADWDLRSLRAAGRIERRYVETTENEWGRVAHYRATPVEIKP